MVYDGITTPYVPVMVKFYRVDRFTGGIFSSKKYRGLRYVNVDTSNMSFSTYDNNNWNFIEDDENYNYERFKSYL